MCIRENKMTNKICLLLIASISVLLFSQSNAVYAAAKNDKAAADKETVRVPAMRNRVYTQFARAQKIADEGDKAGGLAVLDEVKSKIDSLNSYEKAMLWNFYGFMYYGNDNQPEAINSFKKVIAEQAIPQPLRLSTLYSLAQLSMQQQDFTQTIAYLKQWQALNTKDMTANQHVLFAQVYYQNKQYQQSLASLNNAIELVTAKNELPKENWLILQRANYYELKQPKQVTKVMEQLVRHYSKPEYWIQLSGMYGEIGEEDKQLAVMEAAWHAGYIVKSQDILALAQLYRFHQVPIKAANLLKETIAKGTVVANEKNLATLAQCYIAAKEEDKAIPVLKQVTEIAENGQFDGQLAHVFLNMEKWNNAIKYAEKALNRGGIDRKGDMQLIIGMSYYNLEKYEQSLQAFNQALQYKESAKTAKQWTKFVEREQRQSAQLAAL